MSTRDWQWPLTKTFSKRLLPVLALVIASLLNASASQAEEAVDSEIPAELAPWIPWVSADLKGHACPTEKAETICQWPGEATLSVTSRGAQFELSITLDEAGYRPIIGGSGSWPRRVRANGRTLPVISHHGQPAVWLSAGHHTITGEISWSQLPETLELSSDIALVRLTIDGTSVPYLRREGGRLWLRKTLNNNELGPTKAAISVSRLIREGSPRQIETHLLLRVSGSARELVLEHPLLPNTLPLSVSSDLAVTLSEAGDLGIQLAAGEHHITLLARQQEARDTFTNVKRRAPWPASEVWSYEPDPELRAVELSGLPAIDASRTELPEEWRKYGAFVAAADANWTLRTTRRGQTQPPPNQLKLWRELWLDQNADGWTAVDHISGKMHQSWRLDLTSGELGSVMLKGEPQLVTKHQNLSGVELRDSAIDLSAVSRLPRKGRLAAVGWSEDMEQLRATVHLPPGFRLLFTQGVDHASDAWISNWDLFDVFYLLLVGLASWRLCGFKGAAVAAVAVFLCRGEPGSPEYFWLPLLGLVALLGVVRQEKLRGALSLAFNGLLVLAVLVLASFSVDQVRLALFPHLDAHTFDYRAESTSPFGAVTGEAQSELERSAGAPLPDDKMPPAATSSRVSAQKSLALDATPQAPVAPPLQQQVDVEAVVQTGPGIPKAPGHAVELTWSGPVTSDHRLQLFLLSPNVARLLVVLRLGSLWLFLWLLRRQSKLGGPTRRPENLEAVGAAVLLGVTLMLFPRPVLADQPSDARLAQLKERLNRPPACAPDCLSVSAMSLELDSKLTLHVELHAATRSVYRLPGPVNTLGRVEVFLDGEPAQAIRRNADGSLLLQVEPGIHDLRMSATNLPEQLTLELGTPPQHVSISAPDWLVRGLDASGRVPGGTLSFQQKVKPRQGTTERGSAEARQRAVRPFFHVTRKVTLGVSANVVTTVERLSDAASPTSLTLPLLAGEQPKDADRTAVRGALELSFPQGVTKQTVNSTLRLLQPDKEIRLNLTAPPQTTQTETWILQCSVMYHCAISGITPSQRVVDGQASWVVEPFPEESLEFLAIKPKPASGNSVTVRESTLTVAPGVRTSQSQLVLVVQASRPTTHSITIPTSARLSSVSINEHPEAVQSSDGLVTVSLPGGTSRVELSFRDPGGLTVLQKSKSVRAGAPGVNFRTILELPEERWLLAAGGTGYGPALLFWGYLLLIAVAAFLLARVPSTPLKASQWLLLGLGLTQVPVGVAVFIAGWFFTISARRSWSRAPRTRRNLLQLLAVAYSFAFLLCLAAAVYGGLVSAPDMSIQGPGSTSTQLQWYQDRSSGALPNVWTLSVSLWVFRAFMLLWALWLSRALLSWLRFAWVELNHGGFWAPKPQTAPQRSAEGAETSSKEDVTQPETSRD